MTDLNEREQQALDSYRAYVAQRDLCVRGAAPWSTIADWFTEDAVFIDPAWGASRAATRSPRSSTCP